MPAIPVGEYTRKRHKKKAWYLPKKSDEPQHKNGIRNTVCKPAYCHLLHPRTGKRYALARKIKFVIPVAQGPECMFYII
jgi:hypothetical protein